MVFDKSAAALLVSSGSPPYSGGSPRKSSRNGVSSYPSSINPASNLYDFISTPRCHEFDGYGSYNVGVTRSNSVGSLHQMETDVWSTESLSLFFYRSTWLTMNYAYVMAAIWAILLKKRILVWYFVVSTCCMIDTVWLFLCSFLFTLVSPFSLHFLRFYTDSMA